MEKTDPIFIFPELDTNQPMKRRVILALAILAPIAFSQEVQKDEAKKEESAKPVVAAATEKVRLSTSKGDIVIELNREKAPITVENFIGYVKKKHYDGTVFHRVMDGFMIQGGGFTPAEGKLVEKESGKGIKNEASNGLKNDRGTIAMARTNDPDSATAQFFINVVDNKALNAPSPDGHGYAVFGKVVEGMDVVDKIKVVATGMKPLGARLPNGQIITDTQPNVPKEEVVIKTAEVVEAK